MKKLLIHAWILHKHDGQYYIPYTHWIYLQEITKYYRQICLLAPVSVNEQAIKEKQLFPITAMKNIIVHEIPYGGESYASAVKYFFHYYKAYKKQHKLFDKVYVRYPVPFGWLSRFFFSATDRTIHFVGYPLEVTKLNPDISATKKAVLLSLFKPEHRQYIHACKGARVFTNGHHIKDTLFKQGIPATAVTSSTLVESDFYFEEDKQINISDIKLLHIGHLRKWKNIDVIIKAFKHVSSTYPGASLTIVGDGECKEQLMLLAKELNVADRVHFAGHASKREELVQHLRSHDIFCFSSVSEGSPRVILEAMANGINVVSTPVGSLPFVFDDDKHLVFAGFNNDVEFDQKITYLLQNPQTAGNIRLTAYNRAKEFTIKNFIKQVFDRS